MMERREKERQKEPRGRGDVLTRSFVHQGSNLSAPGPSDLFTVSTAGSQLKMLDYQREEGGSIEEKGERDDSIN